MTTRRNHGILQYDVERGVVYFFDDKSGEPLLRLEGIRNVPEGHQLDVHLIDTGGEKSNSHDNCGNIAMVEEGKTGRQPGVVCAVKLADDRGWRPPNKKPETSEGNA